ncbi:hypothetical protein L195_g031962 [Trifolium pratense]|uniref:Uncharacterized protein n=1 Tax=Trifolium pratense TaxID=57577 RepID=A0A2K3LBW4_TRIPR|nr:hypothetical protein L195_g031962 [Trifolium pratense]
MDRKNTKKKAKEVKVEPVILSSDSSSSSGSDETEGDYAEFLKTYKSEDFYPILPSSDEGES